METVRRELIELPQTREYVFEPGMSPSGTWSGNRYPRNAGDGIIADRQVLHRADGRQVVRWTWEAA